jgi:hypothetical protein
MAIHLEDMIEPDLLGCLNWLGHLDRQGYGRWGPSMAHRRVYEMHHGPIPAGLTIDHLCSNRRCVNIDHLEAVSIRENLLRSPYTLTSINARKTHCLHGHRFDESNTYRPPSGGRACRACRRLWQRKKRWGLLVRSPMAASAPNLRHHCSNARSCSRSQELAKAS